MAIPGVNDVVANAVLQLNVQLNTAQITQASNQAANIVNNHFRQVQNNIKATARSQQLLAAQSLGNMFGGIAAQLQLTNARLSAYQQTLNALRNVSNQTANASKLVALSFAGVGAALAGLVQQGVRAAAEFQSLQQSMSAIISGSQTAQISTDQMIESLRTLAIQSGQSSGMLGNTARQFLALGFSGQSSLAILERFTRAAALTGATSQQMQLALNGVAQIAAKGSLSMEELRRQIAENLPGAVSVSLVFERLAENLGITVEEARSLQEQGRITADQGIRALLEAIDRAPGIQDAFNVRLGTMAGQIARLREQANQLVQDAFLPLVQAIVPMLRSFTEGEGIVGRFGERFREFSANIGTQLVAALRAILPTIPPLIDFFMRMAEVVAPIAADVAELGGHIAQVMLPAMSAAARVVSVLTNQLGPLSQILRIIVAASVINGFVRLGASLLTMGGVVGRLAGPFTSLVVSMGRSAGAAAAATGATNGLSAAMVGLRSSAAGAFSVLTSIPGILAGLAVPVAVLATYDALSRKAEQFKGTLVDIQQLGQQHIWSAFMGEAADAVAESERGIGGSIKNLMNSVFGFETEGETRAAKTNEAMRRLLEDAFKIDPEFARRIVNEAPAALRKELDTLLQDFALKYKPQFKAEFKEIGEIPTPDVSGITSAIDKIFSSLQGLATANRSLRDANQGLSKAQENLNRLLAEGGVAERTAALNDLANAEDNVAEAIERRTAAQERLAELLAPATEEELAEARDDILRAEIALARATREREKAQAALNQTSRASLNLQGQSLDQLRTTLANVRASLAAQRRVNKDKKTEEELREDAVDAEITEREAIRTLADAREKLSELETKGLVETKEITAARRALKVAENDVEKAIRRVEEERVALRKIEAGEGEWARQVASARDGVRDAEERVSDALVRVRQANLEYQRSLQQSQGDKNADLNYWRGLLGVMQSIGEITPEAERALNDQFLLAEQIATRVVDKIRELGSAAGGSGIWTTPEGARFMDWGGLITKPTLAWIGERRKAEAVLPLTKPDRAWEILSQSLPHMHPALRARLAAGVVPEMRRVRPTSRQAPQDHSALASAIVEALRSGEFGSDIDINLNGSTTDPDRLARQLARELEKNARRKRMKYGR